MDPTLAEVVASLHSLQQQIQDLRETNALLQASQPQVLTPALHNLQQIQELHKSNNQPETTNHSTQPRRYLKEPKVIMPKKFDGMRSKFRGFVQQVRLLICLQHDRYPDGASQVGLVGTLLLGTTLSWFAPLLEKESFLLHNFDAF